MIFINYTKYNRHHAFYISYDQVSICFIKLGYIHRKMRSIQCLDRSFIKLQNKLYKNGYKDITIKRGIENKELRIINKH